MFINEVNKRLNIYDCFDQKFYQFVKSEARNTKQCQKL